MMHAAQYYYCAVDGLCIGRSSNADGSVEIFDVIPLFHNGTLAPMLETAAFAAEKYAKTRDGVVVGYYYANEHVRDDALPTTAANVASTIASNFDNAVVLQISNSRLEDPDDNALLAFESSNGSTWTRTEKNTVRVDPNATNKFIRALDEKVPIIDFDLHLDDVRLDWRNPQVDRWLTTH